MPAHTAAKCDTVKLGRFPFAAPRLLLSTGAPSVALGKTTLLGLASATLPPPSLVTTHISPVASLLMNKRPWESQASPTGRMQSSGHLDKSGLETMSMVEELLVEFSTGEPAPSKAM